MSAEDTPGGAELVAYQPATRTVDLRDRATDSWTDILTDTITLARGIAGTEFVPAGLRGSEAKVTAAILYSRELGLPPMTGLGATHVIEGRAGISAEMMRALVLQAGHELHIVESTRERCKIRGRRKGSEEWTETTWTIQEAHQTQVFLSKAQGWGPLSAKSQWKSWPTEMLLARATTRLVRMIFPDVAHGMRSVEELEDMTEVVEAEVVAGPPVPAPVQRRRPTPPVRNDVEVVVEEDEAEVPDSVSAAPVQRRTVAPPTPRPSPPVENHAPAVAAEVDTLPDEAPVDEPRMTDEQRDAVTTVQDTAKKKAIAVVQMHWQRLGVADRAERLWYTSVLVRREVESTNDLTREELHDLVTRLERAKDIDAVNAMIPRGSGD